jgi:hypothetical protein
VYVDWRNYTLAAVVILLYLLILLLFVRQGKGKVAPPPKHHEMKAHRGMKVKIRALDEIELLSSQTISLLQRKDHPVPIGWEAGWAYSQPYC